MTVLKSSLVALALIAGMSDLANAQSFSSAVTNNGFATFPGAGISDGYYDVNGGFGNYGLPGTYPNYSGFGLSGYGPGTDLSAYFSASRPNTGPQTTNAMGGLIGTIQKQTGRGNSYQINGMNGVVHRRRAR
ncbi:hypothetical protein P12x_001551 [Tundrisphaera lichenicola]|uniref:hypothetical protein n=1 Tax=Tundrisphaera lichenicola TaxID=2029860 RepID=UPI003EBB7FBF